MEVRVKKVIPEERKGYLHNPKGGGDILFHFDDNRKRRGDKILPGTKDDETLTHVLSTKNRKIEVIELVENGGQPQALQWRLM